MSWMEILKAKKTNIEELVERWDSQSGYAWRHWSFDTAQIKAIEKYKRQQAIKEKQEKYRKEKLANKTNPPSKAERRKLQHSKGKEKL